MELMGVMVIIGLLIAAAGYSVSSNVKRSNREAASNELQMFASNISDAYYDIGSPSINTSDPDAMTDFTRYLRMLANDYMSVTFDEATIATTDKGFVVDISSPLDVYENRYRCWFVTDDSVMKYIMVASGGEDGRIDDSGYKTQDYGDDIVLIVKPKV